MDNKLFNLWSRLFNIEILKDVITQIASIHVDAIDFGEFGDNDIEFFLDSKPCRQLGSRKEDYSVPGIRINKQGSNFRLFLDTTLMDYYALNKEDKQTSFVLSINETKATFDIYNYKFMQVLSDATKRYYLSQELINIDAVYINYWDTFRYYDRNIAYNIGLYLERAELDREMNLMEIFDHIQGKVVYKGPMFVVYKEIYQPRWYSAADGRWCTEDDFDYALFNEKMGQEIRYIMNEGESLSRVRVNFYDYVKRLCLMEPKQAFIRRIPSSVDYLRHKDILGSILDLKDAYESVDSEYNYTSSLTKIPFLSRIKSDVKLMNFREDYPDIYEEKSIYMAVKARPDGSQGSREHHLVNILNEVQRRRQNALKNVLDPHISECFSDFVANTIMEEIHEEF